MSKKTDVEVFLADLEAGIYLEKISHALSDVALGVVTHHAPGSVTLKFDLKQISNSQQVAIKHKISYTQPTAKGKLSEESTSETPMYVNEGGRLSFFPENQGQLFEKPTREDLEHNDHG